MTIESDGDRSDQNRAENRPDEIRHSPTTPMTLSHRVMEGRATLTLGCVALGTSVASACCFLAVWTYWYHELDADCADARDCKCLLFGSSLADGFVGGQRYVCRYVYYSTLASAALAACACVHGGCAALLCRRPPATVGRQRGHRPVPSAPRPRSPQRNVRSQITGRTICFTIVFALMALNMLISSIVLTNGYVSTCQQYVHRVKSYLMVTGNMVELVSSRLSCGAIYDFLDYLQPPSQQVTYELLHRHKSNPRTHIINTWALLTTAIVASWLNTATWIIFIISTFYFDHNYYRIDKI